MTEIILRELNSSDIDWMNSVGRRIEIAAGDRLLHTLAESDCFYLILDGQFEMVGSDAQTSIATFSPGDVIGFFFLPTSCLSTIVQAVEKSLVLAIDSQSLIEKLHQDAGFSARFHRAIAMLLSSKRWQVAASLPESMAMEPHLVMTKAILSVFSVLHDSDMCWMTGAGQVKQMRANEIYLQEGQPLESLDIVLEGTLLMIREGQHHTRSLTSGTPHYSQPRHIFQILPGDILGVTAFLERTPNLQLIKADQDARLLSIAINRLIPKLQADLEFADRFYRALANLMAERLFQIISLSAGSMPIYKPGCSLCDKSEYEGELSIQILQQLSIASTKFDWMLKQLGVKDRM